MFTLHLQPRSNEAGGMYGKGIIARKYEKNQVIKVRVELTANHMGFFEFRICPNNNVKKPASQMCLDRNIMRAANTGDSRLASPLQNFKFLTLKLDLLVSSANRNGDTLSCLLIP